MSLTEEQITAKNFHDFYTQIRPYLNGSYPTPIVNKFSKGDLYSTEEKIIGQWIDGKPLYQKSYTISSVVTLSNGGWTKIIDTPANAIVVDVKGRLSEANNGSYSLSSITFYHDSALSELKGVLNINLLSSFNVNVGSNITIQYTKTTDTAISIGDGNDYSTDEQVIGTWIDGKPVYQKTISCGALPNATTKIVAHNITNLKRVIHLDGYGYRASDSNSQPLPYTSIANYFISVNVIGSNIELYAQGDRSSFEESYITLQYTKSTD